ncbi:hypothetical protein GCM10027430_32510 [Lysobacter tyrosinilyticus]
MGLATTGIAAQWRGGRFAELIVLALINLALAAVLRRTLRWRMASGLALAWLLALVFFVGVIPATATMLFGLAALALGGLFDRHAPAALRLACGWVVIGGTLGWLLPLPVHYRAAYLLPALVLIAWRWRALAESWREAMTEWHQVIDSAPRIAAFAVLCLGLASTACWLPTMQADDLVYHLRLPWQLTLQHRYPLEPGLHIWSLAPWLADVVQAVPQLIAGEEARGAVNALWIVVTAAGVWRLAVALGGGTRAAWLAVALYASVPLTGGLAGGMQTELPTAALLVWLVWIIIDRAEHPRRLWIGAILLGGLLALKLASAAFALLLLPLALWTHRRLPGLVAMLGASALALVLAGSSYVYAAWMARNPVLPLFNAWFRSPYYDYANFDDARWHAGFDAALPWNLTFHTDRYLEAFAGGGGFILIALAGAWLLALATRRTTAVAIAATASLMLALLPMQYLRYLFPALVLMLPLLSLTVMRIDPRRAAWLLIGVCVLNFAFQANSFWLLRIGLVKMTLKEAGNDTAAFRAYAPERDLLATIRMTSHRNVLALDPQRPYVAELGVQGRSISYYDRSLRDAAQQAERDLTGTAWAELLRRAEISDVLVHPGVSTPAQQAALARVGAVRRQVAGDLEWWHVPAEDMR